MLALIAGAGLAVPLRADLRIKVKETFARATATRVEYYKENLWRSESEQSGCYRIVGYANKHAITVDPAKREYSVNTFTRTEETTDPYQTILIEVETRDTGEQRQMFGHPVHHYITTDRRRTEYPDKPPSETREIITDGWYLDVPLPFPNYSHAGGIAVFTALTIDQHGRHTVPKIKVTQNGPVPHGLPVWVQIGDNLSEVTEFSEAPLDQCLFEPPEGFRRVVHPFPGEQLSWNDQFLFRWQQLEGWLVSLFQVAP